MSYKDLKQPLAAASPSAPKSEPKRDEPVHAPGDVKPETTEPKQKPQDESSTRPEKSEPERKPM
jgi:hypothetical protein